MTRNLYLVSDGRAVLADGTENPDGVNAVYAAATNEAEALELADRFDRGEIEPDNVSLPGLPTVGALQN